jgi:hypothetical protein
MERHRQNNAMRHLRKQHELITQQLPRLATMTGCAEKAGGYRWLSLGAFVGP